MSDAPEDRGHGDAATSPGMEPPDAASDDELSEDEITEATPPDADEAQDAPEAS